MANQNGFTILVVAALLSLPLATGAGVLNIDFNGARSVPGPDEPGPTYSGQSAAGGGDVWNGLGADSRLPDGGDDDNLMVEGRNLLDDSGLETSVRFTIGPVGGDVCCAPPVTDELDPIALLNDYIFNNSAGNSAGESEFTISGLGGIERADLYFYIRSGAVTIAGVSGERPSEDNGIYTSANTMIFRDVPVTGGSIIGTIGGGTAVLWGASLSTEGPFPRAEQPSVLSVAPTGDGIRSNAEIAIELEDSVIEVAPNTIQLFVNNAGVEPLISKISGSAITRVSFSRPAGLPEATNRVRIVFGGVSNPTVLQTNDFSFFVINDDDARLVVNIDINGLRPDDTEGATFTGQGAAGGGVVFHGITADSTGGDDNLTVADLGIRNSIGEPTATSFSIAAVGGDNNGAGENPQSAPALFGDYVFVASAGQTTGTSTFTLQHLGSAPTVDLYFYYGVNNAIEIPGVDALPFMGAGPFTSANTIYFKSVPVMDGGVTGVFGSGQVALLHGLSVRMPAPGPYVKSTFPTGSGVLDDTELRIELLDYVTQVLTNTITLSVNGTLVTPNVTQPGGTGLTVVRFQPAGLPESTNRVRLTFADNGTPSIARTNEYSFRVVSRAKAMTVVNIDFDGARNIPGPDVLGPTYSGPSAGGGGQVWNGLPADSRLDDGTDEDNLTLTVADLVNSIGENTGLGFFVSPMGGDVGGAPTTDPKAQGALLSDYIFNNSAANLAGESPFSITGLGGAPFIDLYFYRAAGTIVVADATTTAFPPDGIFTSANTVLFKNVPVVGGTVEGHFGPGTTVVNGMSVVLPLPRPFVKSQSPVGGGISGDSPIRVELQDYVSEVAPDSIQLHLNGRPVDPTVTKPAGSAVTTIEFQPAQKLPSGSTNRVTLVFSDNSSAPALQTSEFSFVVLNEAQAAKIVNIDFNGIRNVPGPDLPGGTYTGQGAAGGGFVWNGIAVDSTLDDGTDEDNLMIRGENLINSLGTATTIGFEVGPVGGDNGSGLTPDAELPAALFTDYLFNNSAANLAGESPFAISGLGDATSVDLYFYRGQGTINIPNAESSPFTAHGIFTPGNTVLFKDVPVTGGVVAGVFGPGTTVLPGLSILIPVLEETASPLAISLDGGAISISWNGPGTLQAADNLGGAWTPLPNAVSPYAVDPTGAARFFRLAR